MSFNKDVPYNLCGAIGFMQRQGKITKEERDILLKYVKSNPPLCHSIIINLYESKRWMFNSLWNHYSGYYWKKPIKKPRLKWLVQHIKLTKRMKS